MSYAADRVAAVLTQHGNAMTLKRPGEANLSLVGKRILTRITDETVGESMQTRFRVKIGTAELNASSWASKIPSPTGDTIVVDGRECTVVDVWPIQDAGATVIYELEVAG